MEGPTPAMLKFAAAIKDAAEEDGFLVVRTRLLGSPHLGRRILVRECYPSALGEAAAAAYHEKLHGLHHHRPARHWQDLLADLAADKVGMLCTLQTG